MSLTFKILNIAFVPIPKILKSSVFNFIILKRVYDFNLLFLLTQYLFRTEFFFCIFFLMFRLFEIFVLKHLLLVVDI